MSLSLAENVIVARADNRPLMLDKTNYSSWASRMLLYIKDEEKLRESVDIIATNIVLQGLPQDIYNFVNQNKDTKQIWDGVKLLIQGSELSLKERESKLYDDFDTFTFMPGETIHSYYMRFTQLINDMHTIGMSMKPLQVNTKFVNHLQPKWSKFFMDVKLAKYMHTTNFDHLYAHLRQHEAHANEVRLERQRYPDQIALVVNYPSFLNPTQYYPQLLVVSQQYYPSLAPQHSYDAPIAPAIQQSSSSKLDSGLVVPSFNPSDDPIANLNKLMAFGYDNNRERNTATNLGVNGQGAPVQARVEKMLLSEALESGAYLDLEQLAFLEDNEDTIIPAQASQEIPTPAAFQTDDLDAFNSDYDDVPSAKAILMANLSSYDSDFFQRQVIGDRNAKVADFEKQIHSLKLQLSATVESHKTLSTTVECLKKESKQKEDKYLDEVIDLQKKNKTLDNVVPALYDGNTIVKTHFALSVTDSEETLKLAEENKKYFEIEKKELSLDNDRVLEHIICQDIMNIVMHAHDQYDNLIPVNNNSLVHDNPALDLLKYENNRLMEMLISKDLVYTNDYKSMEQSCVD
ncbi:hypothetical protein Tco_0633297 [Tanacetum coccineum]